MILCPPRFPRATKKHTLHTLHTLLAAATLFTFPAVVSAAEGAAAGTKPLSHGQQVGPWPIDQLKTLIADLTFETSTGVIGAGWRSLWAGVVHCLQLLGTLQPAVQASGFQGSKTLNP